jgi:hypothetical protein
MAIRMSTGLKNAVLFSSPLISALSFGAIEIYTGSQPASANDAPTGTLLGMITRDGLTWTEGNTQGGLTFTAVPGLSYLIKPSSQTWTLTVTTGGTAGWWRFRSNDDADVCLHGSITAPYQELFIGDPVVSVGETRTINSFQIGFYW